MHEDTPVTDHLSAHHGQSYPELSPEPGVGRVFRSSRRIRLSDATQDGRLRLDAMARYMQDVASDDVADADADDDAYTWVVRRTVIDVVSQFGAADKSVALSTWASATGPRWAGRRTTIAGDAGGRAEAESLWVLIERGTARLARLPAAFDALYAASTLGRTISAKLELDPDPPPSVIRGPWPLRAADIDVLSHANNAVYWAAVETAIASSTHRREALTTSRVRGVLEYRNPVDLNGHLELAVDESQAELSVWMVDGDRTAACAAVRFDPR
jgi:acyl-ACP thioesterase